MQDNEYRMDSGRRYQRAFLCILKLGYFAKAMEITYWGLETVYDHLAKGFIAPFPCANAVAFGQVLDGNYCVGHIQYKRLKVEGEKQSEKSKR